LAPNFEKPISLSLSLSFIKYIDRDGRKGSRGIEQQVSDFTSFFWKRGKRGREEEEEEEEVDESMIQSNSSYNYVDMLESNECEI